VVVPADATSLTFWCGRIVADPSRQVDEPIPNWPNGLSPHAITWPPNVTKKVA
jgi:hypothetical protein